MPIETTPGKLSDALTGFIDENGPIAAVVIIGAGGKFRTWAAARSDEEFMAMQDWLIANMTLATRQIAEESSRGTG